MIKGAVMVILHFILGGWGYLRCFTCRTYQTLGATKTSYTTSLCPPGAAMFKAREPVFPCTAIIPRNKANHLQRDSNCFLPQGGKTVKLDRCRIRVSDVILCNTSVLIVSGNPARTLESKADRWVNY